MKNILLKILNIELSRKKIELSDQGTELSHLSFVHLPFSQREEKNLKAFTLVELIVVITILAILGTIAFLSFQSYTVYARDAVRISNLRNLESGLKIQYTQGGAYAVPDDSVNITASGTLIRQQGVFGKQSNRTIKANTDGSKDPLTGEYYDYVVDNNLSEYQLVGYMEGDEVAYNVQQNLLGNENIASLQNTYALTGATLKTLGQDLGIVFSGGIAVHKSGIDVDIRQPNSELTIVFDEGDEITSSSGSELFSNVYNRSRALLKNKELAKLDESLVLYFDMETTTMSGGVKVLKDFSQYGNNGTCMDGGDKKDCGEGGPFFENENGLYFDGINDYIDIGNIYILTPRFVTIGGEIDISNVGKRVHLGKGGGTTGNYYIVIETNGVLRFWFDIGSGRNYVEGNHIDVVDKRGYFFTGTFDGNQAKVYINGQLLGVKDLPGELRVSHYDTMEIGYGYNNYYTEGNIHNVFIYNRALSQNEIQTIYGSTLN